MLLTFVCELSLKYAHRETRGHLLAQRYGGGDQHILQPSIAVAYPHAVYERFRATMGLGAYTCLCDLVSCVLVGVAHSWICLDRGVCRVVLTSMCTSSKS